MSSNRIRPASNANREPATPVAARPRTRRPAASGGDTQPSMPARVRDLDAAQRDEVRGYLEGLRDQLSLGHWELDLDFDEQCAEDCDAQVSCVEGRFAAVMWLHDRFFTLPRAEQRRVLVHELLHMHTSAVVTAARLSMRSLNKDARTSMMGYVRDAEEHTVDALSTVLGSFLPLPPWTEPAEPAKVPR